MATYFFKFNWLAMFYNVCGETEANFPPSVWTIHFLCLHNYRTLPCNAPHVFFFIGGPAAVQAGLMLRWTALDRWTARCFVCAQGPPSPGHSGGFSTLRLFLGPMGPQGLLGVDSVPRQAAFNYLPSLRQRRINTPWAPGPDVKKGPPSPWVASFQNDSGFFQTRCHARVLLGSLGGLPPEKT